MRRSILIFIALGLLILAGCNLDSPGGTPAQTGLDSTPHLTAVVPTPYIAPSLIPQQGFGPQVVGTPAIAPTSDPLRILTPVPAQTLIAQPAPGPATTNAIEVFVNNILIPAWNFLYTFILEGVGTLWQFAGARGGAFAQVFCCIAPIIVVVAAVLLRFRILRWRR